MIHPAALSFLPAVEWRWPHLIMSQSLLSTHLFCWRTEAQLHNGRTKETFAFSQTRILLYVLFPDPPAFWFEIFFSCYISLTLHWWIISPRSTFGWFIMVMRLTITPEPNVPSAELFRAVCVYFKFSMESILVENWSCLAVVITAVGFIRTWGQLLWFYYKQKNCRCCWMTRLKFNLQPGALQCSHIYILTNCTTLLPLLIATNPHFHKHFKDQITAALGEARSTRQSEECFCLMIAMLADWPHALHMRDRQSGPALHTL